MKSAITILGLLALLNPTSQWASTINVDNRSAYGASLGWINWRADSTNGAVLAEYVCSGFLYSGNAGWICLGSGAPANGIQYQNDSPTDYGVNHDGQGHLRGYAYAANLGWIAFENIGAPRVDLHTGKLSGSIYSANCGWISLSNSIAVVQTDRIAPSVDADHNGLADAWELQNFGRSGVEPNDDLDHDAMSNLQEYLADTDPRDATSNLRILNFEVGSDSQNWPTYHLSWSSRPTRAYRLEYSTDLISSWSDFGFLFSAQDGPATECDLGFGPVAQSHRFFRVKAVKPLSP
jgi:hypothetical protein